MMLTEELIKEYTKNPRSFDYTKGMERAGIDFWCGELPTFDKDDSQSFRDGYVVGYVQSVAMEQPMTQEQYDDAIRQMIDTFDRRALVKYKDAKEYCGASSLSSICSSLRGKTHE